MSDVSELASLASAASYLLLNAPDADTLAVLQRESHKPLELGSARQDFYDYLCIPQSGCFLPPFAHVLSQAQEAAEYWHFPTPRYDGGDALMQWYDAAGFDASLLPADSILASANRPLDHVGTLLAYLALLLDAAQDSEADRAVLAEFLGEHLQPWAQTFVNLLVQAQSPYISQLGAMLRDLFDTVCEAFPPMLPRPFIAPPKHIPIQVE
ncbi:molecular chaperone TorD family protein [Thiomonas sp. FB-Cd]|uniref:molecular chaperone TorD family protein n=1 Tax=Thiomonas sp. FB-Cd TaxID=1158292 RepID=UPI0004DEF45F|nr:molecular chaperone TorD family protein [Thiomonas sp. FB-Cd]